MSGNRGIEQKDERMGEG
jgi:hypothetical protein